MLVVVLALAVVNDERVMDSCLLLGLLFAFPLPSITRQLIWIVAEESRYFARTKYEGQNTLSSVLPSITTGLLTV